jgi:hypothetical protein
LDWDIVFQVPFAIAVTFAAWVFHQNGCATRNSVDNPVKESTFKRKRNMGSSPNIEFLGSPFLLRNQFVPVFGMPEHVASDRLKSTSGAIALNPGQHFA